MTISVTITRARLAVAIVVAALLVPTTAYASHVFGDVDDGAFYAAPVAWAFDNGITTGKTASAFVPDAAVTRGESVTFLKRYHDNVVNPADEVLRSDVDANAESIAATAEELAAHSAHVTTYFVIVGPGGVINNSNYPGASAVEFAAGVYHIDLPGLEVYDWDEGVVLCDLQTNSLSSEGGLRVTGATFSDDHPRDEYQVIAWSALLNGTLTDDGISVQITC